MILVWKAKHILPMHLRSTTDNRVHILNEALTFCKCIDSQLYRWSLITSKYFFADSLFYDFILFETRKLLITYIATMATDDVERGPHIYVWCLKTIL